jgi:hypothetical protein
MSDHKKFFLEVLDDLKSKCDSNSNYNYVKAAGLLRQLLIDEVPLIDIVNREYKEKIIYEVVKKSPDPPRQQIGQDGLVYTMVSSISFINPTPYSRDLDYINKDQFLKYKIFNYEGRDVSVLEILKLNANSKGGVHFEKKDRLTLDEFFVERANSGFVDIRGVTIGASAVSDIGKITLKALTKLEERVRADIALNKK